MVMVGDNDQVNLLEAGDMDGVLSGADLLQARRELVSRGYDPDLVVAEPGAAADIASDEAFVLTDQMLGSFASAEDWLAQLYIMAELPSRRSLGMIMRMEVHEVQDIPHDADARYGQHAIVMDSDVGIDDAVFICG